MARSDTEVSDRPRLNKEKRKKLLEHALACRKSFHANVPLRSNMEIIDRYYNRSYGSNLADPKAVLANMLGGKFRAPDIIVPMVMPQIETATGKMAATFLEGSPIFLAGADPENEDAALQYNTIVKENSTRGGWDAELIRVFRDGYKYNVCGFLVDWGTEQTFAVKNDESNNPKRVDVTWSGNVLKWLNMYNTFWDWRVRPCDVASDGDFVGYSELLPLAKMKKYTNSLFQLVPPEVTVEALNSSCSAGGPGAANESYYIPSVAMHTNSAISRGPVNDWRSFFGVELSNNADTVKYQHAYVRTTMYVRIIPSTFDLEVSDKNHPQIFKLVVINDSVLLECVRMTNLHDLFPVLLAQPYDDGLELQTSSMAENLMDLQDTTSALWNATLFSKRRAVADRGIYNPKFIDKKDIDTNNPAAKIPLRAAAYDMDISRAYYPIPYRDEQSPHFVNTANALERYSYVAAGTNQMEQGQFVRGNKTKSEVDDVMEGTASRERLSIIAVRSKLLIPARRLMLINTLQYQQGTTYVNTEEKKAVEIDPVKLRNATLFFQIGDGFSPLDREMSTEEYAVALQTLQSVPAIGSEYRVGDMFAYLMQLRGADLRPFKLTKAEIDYNNQMAVWQQQAQLAAERGAPFDAPMPKPPNEEQLKQDKQQQLNMQQSTLAQMVAAGEANKGK